MSVLDSDSTTLTTIIEDHGFDEAQVAAAAFLARYNGRTLDAYRFDLRTFFQWAADADLTVLEAKRPHIELYRTAMEQKGLAPSTIDRRLSTVCGFYRFALIDGRVNANPAQYVRRPKVHPSKGRGLDRREFGTSSSRPSVSIRAMPLWPCSSASTGFGSVRHVEPISRISTSPRDTGPSGSWEREASLRWFPSSPPLGALHRQAGRTQCRLPSHAPFGLHHGRPRCRCSPP